MTGALDLSRSKFDIALLVAASTGRGPQPETGLPRWR